MLDLVLESNNVCQTNVEMHGNVLIAPGILAVSRSNRSGSGPLVVGLLPEGDNLLALAQDLNASRIQPDAVDGAVEVGRLAVWREDLLVEEISDAALNHHYNVTDCSIFLFSSFFFRLQTPPQGGRTVKTRPTMTIPKLNVCWAARAVFSRPDSSVQGIRPSSLNGVTDRRLDSAFCVA